MSNREYPILTPDMDEALQAFAADNGRKWKDELVNVYWYNARIWSGPKGDRKDFGYTLHEIRNNFGPEWLYDVYKLPRKLKEK